MARPSDKCNTDRNPASAQATSSQGCRSRRSTVSEGSKAFPLPLHQHRVLSQLMSVGVCGFQTLTVPESQPYLAETVHPSLLGRFYRPKNVTFESSIKLNVTEGVSPWILGTPGGGSVGSKESSQPGLSNASKPSSLRVAGTTDAGASPESTRSSGNPYQREERGGAYTVQKCCRIDYSKWRELRKSPTCMLPLYPQRNSPLAPWSISPTLKTGQTKILCVSTISPDLPQFNFEVRMICRQAPYCFKGSKAVRRYWRHLRHNKKPRRWQVVFLQRVLSASFNSRECWIPLAA